MSEIPTSKNFPKIVKNDKKRGLENGRSFMALGA